MIVIRLVLGVILLGAAGDALAMRCGSRVISTGDLDFQVRDRCGEPAWVEQRSELRVTGAGSPIERARETVIETWYYNQGSGRLVRAVEFRDGRVSSIGTLGHGTAAAGSRCGDTAFSRGISQGELVIRCGEPAARRSTYSDEVLRDGQGNERVRRIPIDEWTYRLPGQRMLRNVVFIDGRLSRVEHIAP